MKRPWLLWFSLPLAIASHAADEKKAPAGHAEANPLVVAAEQQHALGIATAAVSDDVLTEEIRAPGEVKANAYATTLVSPRIPAQVVRRHAKLGEAVKPGQPLVTLSSVEVAEAQGALIVAARDWERVRQLGSDAVSAKRYTESQVARDQALAKLRAYGVGDGEIRALSRQGSSKANGEFALAAPQAGRITTDDFVTGERVDPGKVLFTLVDESSVWVEAQLAPNAAERVAQGALARVVAHEQTLDGKVIQRSHRTTEASRTTPLRIEVPNTKDVLHAGEFVEAFIATSGTTKALAVPAEAIVQLQGQPTVFRLEGTDRFEPTPVQTGETRGDRTAIRQGLAAGDIVAVRGAYALKARLLKSQLGEGHGD